MTIYIGIDPGVSEKNPGAIAVLNGASNSVDVFDIPAFDGGIGERTSREIDIKQLIQQLSFLWVATGNGIEVVSTIERTSAFTSNKTTVFSQGEQLGVLKAVMEFFHINPYLIRPSDWKKHFELTGKDKTKNDSLNLGRKLFPAMEKELSLASNHGRAEALLLMEYGRFLHLQKAGDNTHAA